MGCLGLCCCPWRSGARLETRPELLSTETLILSLSLGLLRALTASRVLKVSAELWGLSSDPAEKSYLTGVCCKRS